MHEWRRSQIGSIRTIGTLLVLPITGYVFDRWDRRIALTINAFNTGLDRPRALLRKLLRVVLGSRGAGVLGRRRGLLFLPHFSNGAGRSQVPYDCVIAGATISTLFALGQVILGLIAWGVPAWRPFKQESVRWLVSKGRYEESEQILKKVAKANETVLLDKSLKALRATAEAEKNTVKPKEPWLVVLVFRSRVILSRCLVSSIWWFTNTLVYSGMNINSVNMTGNGYLNYVAVAVIKIPGYSTAILLLDRVGRKLCSSAHTGCALPASSHSLSCPTVTMACGCFYTYSAVVMTSVYVYTAELYPTQYRHNLFAFSSMVGRLGSITAPRRFRPRSLGKYVTHSCRSCSAALRVCRAC